MNTSSGNQTESPFLYGKLVSKAENVLKDLGWKVEKIKDINDIKKTEKIEKLKKLGSVRRITNKDGESKFISICTSEQKQMQYTRVKNGWKTLGCVDAVVAVSSDKKKNSKKAMVHMFDGDDIRARFDRAYKAKKIAGKEISVGNSMYIYLYEPETEEFVGAGAGLESPPIAVVLL